VNDSLLLGRDVIPHPAAPQTLEESGLTLDLVLQLVLKMLHFSGELTGTELSRRIGLAFRVLSPAIDLLKAEQQLMIVGGGFVGGASYRYRITDAGRTRAALFLETSHYVGFAPVPLSQYYEYMRAFRAAAPGNATQERIRRAFSHLVISDRVLDQLGPAINAGHSMFVYGPPGNGKTVISQAIRSLLDGDMAIPHALEVEGNIIRVFDPVNHEVVDEDADDSSITAESAHDRRWLRCRRPMVMVGGELTLASLELSYSPTTGFYRAPVQAVANGGVLVIDDFGRQTCSPRDLLNRWIVPLESRVDFLTLQTGQKFELPFMTLIVFATNIRPAELVDEAFLRRIQYKIFAESPTLEDFTRIFQNNCRDLGATFEDGLIEHLLYDYYRPRKIALRGCHPRDLIKQALSLAAYLNRPPHLTPDLLEAACNSYFVDDRDEPAVYA
jgi:predicted ATPase with chaperone activity